jgi:hypothetical protein
MILHLGAYHLTWMLFSTFERVTIVVAMAKRPTKPPQRAHSWAVCHIKGTPTKFVGIIDAAPDMSRLFILAQNRQPRLPRYRTRHFDTNLAVPRGKSFHDGKDHANDLEAGKSQ